MIYCVLNHFKLHGVSLSIAMQLWASCGTSVGGL